MPLTVVLLPKISKQRAFQDILSSGCAVYFYCSDVLSLVSGRTKHNISSNGSYGDLGTGKFYAEVRAT